MYAEAYFSTFWGIARPLGVINKRFRVFCGLNVIIKAPGQFRGLRVGLWSNALGVSPDEDSEIIVNAPTSTLKLKLLMLNIKYIFFTRIQEHKLKF
jgi:hypothetical protein